MNNYIIYRVPLNELVISPVNFVAQNAPFLSLKSAA